MGRMERADGSAVKRRSRVESEEVHVGRLRHLPTVEERNAGRGAPEMKMTFPSPCLSEHEE